MREVRVSSVQPLRMPHLSPFQGERDRGLARQKVEANIEMACRLLAQAGSAGCDIVCYPEDMQGIAHYAYYLDDLELFTGFIETVPGPTTERISEVARQHRMHIVFGISEREGTTFYNTAVLMGRQGEILGKYRKVHLPASERWSACHGDGFPVFETDIGKVGILICYDILFPEAARCLSLNGAELLFNPTMAYDAPGQCKDNGVLRVRMRALDSFAPLAVSLCGSGTIIVNSDGNILAQARPGQEEVIAATVDLDGGPKDPSQWELFTGTADVRARYIQERVPEAYAVLTASDPPVLQQFEGKRLRSQPEEIREAYEIIRERWSK